MVDTGTAVFKHLPQDFIVEEIGDNYTCKVSDSTDNLKSASVDFAKLDVNDRRPFLSCDLEKINLDHFSTLSILAKELNNMPHELGYAGTKDKNAWTCQRISIFNADIERIKEFSFPGIALKNFKWIKHKIKIGDLAGNRFTIVLRDVDKDAIKVLSKVRNTQNLPNFFGAQRSGSLRKENVTMAKLIFKQKFQEAVFAFLIGFGENESESVKKAKKRLKDEKNIRAAKDYFPLQLTTEWRMLNHLHEFEKDWMGALMTIGEKTLLIMCAALQSKLFNELLQRAIDERISLNDASLQLLGYNSKFSSGRIGELEREVLRDNGLELKDFQVPQLPSLSLKSSIRKAFFQVRELDIETKDDEIFTPSKKIILKFVLDSGTYATTLLEQFFILR